MKAMSSRNWLHFFETPSDKKNLDRLQVLVTVATCWFTNKLLTALGRIGVVPVDRSCPYLGTINNRAQRARLFEYTRKYRWHNLAQCPLEDGFHLVKCN